MEKHAENLFKPPLNCWRVEKASHAAVIVDYGNYYRDLHEAISQAKHSIFLLGWDIDSRMELLRGEEAEKNPRPHVFFDLIQQKARENPDLMIYLDRWNYSMFFLKDRESLSEFHWRWSSPPNVHFCLDTIIPYGACHHQKVAVIDDAIAFCGGMDVALGRWDFREHHTHNPLRKDPGGTFAFYKEKHFGPYHDIMIAVSGDAARALAELARTRWKLAAGFEAIPLRAAEPGLPHCWPHSDPPDFYDAKVAISLTVPPIYDTPPIRQAEHMYIDMIEQAENFIYMENQFFSHVPLAEALKKRLIEKPGLRALLMSCYEPQGIMEKKAMWGGRLKFHDVLKDLKDQVAMVYSCSSEDGVTLPVRIHSKLMIVDDKYLRIGSTNINRRSMGFDTECDIILTGEDEKIRRKIADVRNDLIREHSGQEHDDIEFKVMSGAPVQRLLDEVPTSTQHFRPWSDDQFASPRFQRIATAIADPTQAFIPSELTLPYKHPSLRRNIGRQVTSTLALMVLIALFIGAWRFTPMAEYATPEKIMPVFEGLRAGSWGLPAAIALFAAATFCFFPVTVMIGAAAAVFGPVIGLAVSLAGVALTATLGFLVGKLLGRRMLRTMLGPIGERVREYLNHGGAAAIAVLRLIPVAPFNAVNLGLGISGLSFIPYIAGTLLGMLPGMIAISWLGHSFMQLWENPDRQAIALAAAGIAGWIAFTLFAQVTLRRWQERHFPKAAA